MNAQVKIIPSYPTQMFHNYRLMCALGQSDWLGVGRGGGGIAFSLLMIISMLSKEPS